MFYQLISKCKPHQGYYHLLQSLQQQFNNNYFICTSNIDGFFAKSGFDPEKIYEVHGTIDNIQCMDKKCSIQAGHLLARGVHQRIPRHQEGHQVLRRVRRKQRKR